MDINKVYIGYSNNENLRLFASSGGIGSEIIRYLFEANKINTTVSFEFEPHTLKYVPGFIFKFNDYRPSGSIYHEIDLISYIKNNVEKIQGNFACFALPCQVKPIRNFCNKNGIKNYIIGLVCSVQQSFKATEYLLKRLRISKDDVKNIKYRGNGWPGGITITKKDNNSIYIENLGPLWSNIFHSRLFMQSRCYKCKNTLNEHSDIVLGDPWISEFIKSEKSGQTLFKIYNQEMYSIINKMTESGIINMRAVDPDLLAYSQRGTIARKESYLKHKMAVKIIRNIFSNRIYNSLVTSCVPFFKLHCIIKSLVEKIIRKI